VKAFRERWISIKFAWAGVRYVLSTQPNARLHLLIAAAVLILGIVLRITPLEFAVILIMISVVWSAELFNTAVEVLVDYISPEKQPFAKICKDVSAGAVLVTAVISVLVGLMIFLPRLWFLYLDFFYQ
jgi:diacylglycerol kinase